MPDEPVVDVDVTVPPESGPEPEEAPAASPDTADLINHDRLTAVESALAELRERIGGLATVEALQSITVPPHEHPEYATHAELESALSEAAPAEELAVIDEPPAPEPEPEPEDETPGEPIEKHKWGLTW